MAAIDGTRAVSLAKSRRSRAGTFVDGGAAMTIVHRLPAFLVATAGFAVVPACHSAFAAETPKVVSPSVDIEVEDKSPGNAAHTARFNVSLSNGSGDINASDGDARYAVSAHAFATSEPKVALKVKRSDRSPALDLEVSAAIPQQPGGRILLARIDRADGHVTTIVAQSR